jgi:hypothetical protein
MGLTTDSIYVSDDSLHRPDITKRALAILRKDSESLRPLRSCGTSYFDIYFTRTVYPLFFSMDTSTSVYYAMLQAY